MGSDFSKVEFLKVFEFVSDKVPVISISLEDYVSTENLLPDFGGLTRAASIPDNGKVSAYMKGDILFSNIRTYFKKLWYANKDGGCSNDVIVFRAKAGLDSRFAFYSLMNEEFISHTVQTSKGTKMPRGDKDAIAKYKLSLPSVHDQKIIAHILGSLDNKIELNRQANETLEKMAQALFKSWFVDFDPVIDNALGAGNTIPDELQERAARRQQQLAKPDHKPLPDDIRQLFPSEFQLTEALGWVPMGWECESLLELTTELRRGISPKYVADGGVAVINQKCIRNHEVNHTLCRRNNPELRKIDGRELLLGDVLVNSTGVGTLGRIAQVTYLPELTVVDSHVTVVRPNQSKYPVYVFGQMMLSIESYIESLGEGSTGQTELSRKIVSEQKILIPDLETLKVANQQFRNLAEKVVINSKEIKSLTSLRDTLLPKLISGELRLPSDALPDAEQQLADATSQP